MNEVLTNIGLWHWQDLIMILTLGCSSREEDIKTGMKWMMKPIQIDPDPATNTMNLE